MARPSVLRLAALAFSGLALPAQASGPGLRGAAAGNTSVAASAATFQCQTSLNLGPVADASRKGIAVDDTTLQSCSGAIPRYFPHTKEPVTSLRLFKPWDAEWPDEERLPAWENLVAYVKGNEVQVLLGTGVTCNKTLDAQTWEWTKELLKMLGPGHIMGLAIGNELEILYKMGDRYKLAPVTPECVDRMWKGGYFSDVFTRTVTEFDALGFRSVPVTSVFGGYALAGTPFVEEPHAMVNSFLKGAVRRYGRRYVFTFNFYPYFDTNMHLDGDGRHCAAALHGTTCWEGGCFMPMITGVARQRVAQLAPGSVMWLGETGWSSPFAPSLESQMSQCGLWSSEGTLRTFYENFLHWDLAEVEHVFYFTVRDSKVFGVPEYFGLLSTCQATDCKLKDTAAPAARAADTVRRRDATTVVNATASAAAMHEANTTQAADSDGAAEVLDASETANATRSALLNALRAPRGRLG